MGKRIVIECSYYPEPNKVFDDERGLQREFSLKLTDLVYENLRIGTESSRVRVHVEEMK